MFPVHVQIEMSSAHIEKRREGLKEGKKIVENDDKRLSHLIGRTRTKQQVIK